MLILINVMLRNFFWHINEYEDTFCWALWNT